MLWNQPQVGIDKNDKGLPLGPVLPAWGGIACTPITSRCGCNAWFALTDEHQTTESNKKTLETFDRRDSFFKNPTNSNGNAI